MPKYVVKKFAEFMCEVIVEAETEDDAYDAAKELSSDAWSDWSETSEWSIDYDFIEEISKEQ